MERKNTRMMALQRMKQIEDQRNGIYEDSGPHQQKYNYYEYEHPQVRKTGVDAVHGSCPQMVYIMKNCNL